MKIKMFLLVPQVGAGRKEVDNTFSGMLMGVVDVKKKASSEIGLFGYNSGRRTFFLDGNTGKVEIGIEESKITFDPSRGRALIEANYNEALKTGLKIDLIEPSITFGSGNFSVDGEGYLKATGVNISGRITAEELEANGCYIGSFRIYKNAFLMTNDSEEDINNNPYYDKEIGLGILMLM